MAKVKWNEYEQRRVLHNRHIDCEAIRLANEQRSTAREQRKIAFVTADGNVTTRKNRTYKAEIPNASQNAWFLSK